MSRPVAALPTTGLLVPLVLLAACSAPEPGGLRAVLTSPTDVHLGWHPEPGAAGQIVEHAEPGGDYTALSHAQPGDDSYEHPRPISGTWSYYRVRSYFGPVSTAVDVVPPPGDEVPEGDLHEWAEPRRSPSGTHPVRSAAATPTGLRAEVEHANGILFTWTDRAGDEEGCLVEVRPAGAAEFSVVAALDADVTSFGLITPPTEKHVGYRVRAYYHGPVTAVAH
ncbi:fibronectin type III domain-containing protein [Actinosynnema sp. NPDC023587]|uniref:fibronectin type III domain-containing protein n=1 Tax=Actinosynnema sp. NPDC023587 TaxID=3154695 RepID=UPI0033E174AE